MPDNFSPDVGQHVDAAGRVTYDFDAHLHARGVDIDQAGPAGLGSSPDHKVRWLDANGAVVAEIVGWLDDNGDPHLTLSAGNATLELYGPIGLVGEPAIASRIDLIVATQVITVLDGAGHSGFVKS
jgi:hypothetical protein